MDEYDLLLSKINLEKRIKEEKKFWRGKRWIKKQIEEMSAIKPPLKINKIKSIQEVQREQMREQMGLSDTGGMTITKENVDKLINDLLRAIPIMDNIFLDDELYEDFRHFCSALMEKYFTKE